MDRDIELGGKSAVLCNSSMLATDNHPATQSVMSAAQRPFERKEAVGGLLTLFLYVVRFLLPAFAKYWPIRRDR